MKIKNKTNQSKKEKLKSKFVEIDCPVCGHYHFKYYDGWSNKNIYICPQCGWDYDLIQLKDHDKATKYTDKSINQQKKEYQKKIEKDPNYSYISAIENIKKPHKCPVCGKTTFSDVSSYEICSFCGWEDDDLQESCPNFSGGPNDLSLNQARREYRKKIKENPNYCWEDAWDQEHKK